MSRTLSSSGWVLKGLGKLSREYARGIRAAFIVSPKTVQHQFRMTRKAR